MATPIRVTGAAGRAAFQRYLNAKHVGDCRRRQARDVRNLERLEDGEVSPYLTEDLRPARLLLRKRLSMFMASASASVERNGREERTLERDRRHPHLKGRLRSL